jgi:hypothetical protein
MGKVFLNDEIYRSSGDYIIGGFQTDKEGFSISDCKTAVSNKLSELIDEYIEQAVLWNLEMGIYEDPLMQAKMDLAAVISDNLKVTPAYLDKDTFIETILDSDEMMKWFMTIENNIAEATNHTTSTGVINQALSIDTSSPIYMDAMYFSLNTTLQQVIEEISMIEL